MPTNEPTNFFNPGAPMDPRLQRLLDEQDILDLTNRYCWAVDNLDRAQLGSIFTADATADFGAGSMSGFDAIWNFLNASLSSLTVSQHLLGSHQISVTGDSAHVRSYLSATQVRTTADGARQLTVTAKYADDVVRTADGWRIKHKQFTLQWIDADPLLPTA